MQANYLALRRGIIYEGDVHQLWSIYPTPLVVPAVYGGISKEGKNLDLYFREDVFDPLTRIRRGRFYENRHGNTTQYNLSNVFNGLYGRLIGVDSGDFDYDELLQTVTKSNVDTSYNEIVQLGADNAKTFWRIIGIEKNIFGHYVFTLRAKSLFGVLPELNDDLLDNGGELVDPEKRNKVQKQMDRLVDVFHRNQTVSIIDAAREACRAILASWIGEDASRKDLDKIIKLIQEDKKVIINSAFIVNRMHPRGKSAELEDKASRGSPLRELNDEDAETSVHLIGLILREIEWAVS